jgi:hypothetical protein
MPLATLGLARYTFHVLPRIIRPWLLFEITVLAEQKSVKVVTDFLDVLNALKVMAGS